MTGSVYNRGSRRGWAYQIFLGRDETGRQRRITKSGFRTRREAQAALHERLTELLKTPAPAEPPNPGESITLRRILDVFFEGAARRIAPKTLERYRYMVPYFHEALLEAPVAELTTMTLEREYWRLRESGGRHRRTRQARPLSARTVRNMAGLVSAALNDAVRLGLIAANPAAAVRLPPTENVERRSLDAAELKRYLAAAAGHWIEPLLRVAAATGCRRGELLALTWDDIDLEAGVITISKSLEQTRAGLRLKETKTRQVRRIRIGASTIEALLEQRARNEEWRAAVGPGYRDAGIVFAAPDGGHLRPNSVTAEACRVARKAGLPGVGLHTLRHTHGSMLLSAGVPLPAVSKRLGHANPNITAAVYSHALPQDDERAVEAWERVSQPRPEGMRRRLQ